MTLEGSASGATRAEIKEKVTALAATYYGTECLTITLGSETCETDREEALGGQTLSEHSTFTANWTADIRHRWETPVYGPTFCVTCEQKDWGKR